VRTNETELVQRQMKTESGNRGQGLEAGLAKRTCLARSAQAEPKSRRRICLCQSAHEDKRATGRQKKTEGRVDSVRDSGPKTEAHAPKTIEHSMISGAENSREHHSRGTSGKLAMAENEKQELKIAAH
jgi:hypothetical protein